MEKYGSGIKRVLDLFRERGLNRPQFRELQNGFDVVVFSGKTTQKTTQKKSLRDRILAIAKNKSHATRTEFALELGISENTVKEYLAKLKLEGLLERTGPDKGGYWKVKDRK